MGSQLDLFDSGRRGAVCERCGAKMVEYKHKLSEPLVSGLVKLQRSGGGPINLRDVGLTRNQWDNFQKLRYFDLVVPVRDEEGNRRGGVWAITDRGRAFLAGHIRVSQYVWTYRGERTNYDGDERFVYEVSGGYQTWQQWAAEAKPHLPVDEQ